MKYNIGDKLKLLNRSKININYAKIIDNINNKYLVEFSENGINWFKCPYEIEGKIFNRYWEKI